MSHANAVTPTPSDRDAPLGIAGTLLALAAGLLAWAALGGWRILDPSGTGWLLQGDFAQHWLGWQFFRETPFWQLPLGRNDNWGLTIGSTVVFTDSIPLLALAFKAVSGWLPRHFQYFGLWTLGCLLLQALLGARLLRLLGADRPCAVLGAGFFALAPPLLFRLQGHMALAGQWLLLAALLLHLGRAFRPARWLALLAAALLTHAYLFAMVFAVFLADLARRALRREARAGRLAWTLAAALGLTAALMALVGYFAAGESGAGGFGVFRLNLNALFNPLDRWSAYLPRLADGYGDFEGFNYLGLGGMAALALALGLRLARGSRVGLPPLVPLAALCALLTLFALSDRVALGRTELLHIPLPALLEKLGATFRSSGRFFWVPFYALLALSLARVATALPPRAARTALALLLALQVADLRPGLASLDERFATPPAFATPLRSPFWEEAARPGGRLLRIPPENLPDDWIAFSLFAMDHSMKTNYGVFARVSEAKLLHFARTLADQALAGSLRAGSVNVFHNEALWAGLLNAGQAGFAGVVDGLRVFVPGPTAGREQAPDSPGSPGRTPDGVGSPGPRAHWPALDETGRSAALARVDVAQGQTTPFGSGEPGNVHLADGWHEPHPGGVWAAGRLSRLVFRMDPLPEGDLEVEIRARFFVMPGRHDAQVLEACLERDDGGRSSLRREIRDGAEQSVTLRVPRAHLERGRGLAAVRLEHLAPAPLSLTGTSASGRLISMEILSMAVRPAR
ncbi:hypothetical protein NNJEOMEG_02910 [Fundidesulfovibrio magnetotacticus]|uniref:Uncharacterized protein n=1 Tax=Fundidesulfovibrio magnetotacticus TaxID=2730080 RepID=A0A6V8LZI4_9BACT|nr:DUF6311 domain-containing protein [Fundidesulfovibrio magnetotacticus]GFK95057.1 hypothetical protein NNJEOMEG_02910 [Fundidesulfovibrio magnetotacticus]